MNPDIVEDVPQPTRDDASPASPAIAPPLETEARRLGPICPEGGGRRAAALALSFALHGVAIAATLAAASPRLQDGPAYDEIPVEIVVEAGAPAAAAAPTEAAAQAAADLPPALAEPKPVDPTQAEQTPEREGAPPTQIAEAPWIEMPALPDAPAPEIRDEAASTSSDAASEPAPTEATSEPMPAETVSEPKLDPSASAQMPEPGETAGPSEPKPEPLDSAAADLPQPSRPDEQAAVLSPTPAQLERLPVAQAVAQRTAQRLAEIRHREAAEEARQKALDRRRKAAEETRRSAADEARSEAAQRRRKAANEARREAAAEATSLPEGAPSALAAGRAGAGAQSALSQGSIGAYRGQVIGHLARFKRYPDSARSRGAEGRPAVAFTLDGAGQVTGVSLARSSGHADIDAETVAMVRRAAPFPPPPPGAPHAFSASIGFQLH